MSDTVTIENQWASAAETGMAEISAVFGTVSNKGDHEARMILPGVVAPGAYLGQMLLESR